MMGGGSVDILVQFKNKFDKNWKMAKSEVGSKIVQNDSKWSLIIISSDISAQCSQEVDQNWKKAKSEGGSTIAQNKSKWFLIQTCSHIK